MRPSIRIIYSHMCVKSRLRVYEYKDYQNNREKNTTYHIDL